MSKRDLLIENLPRSESEKILKIKNEKVMEFVNYYYDLMKPSSIFIVTDSRDDYEFVRNKAIELGEESKLKKDRNTYHFDNYYDQARDKENTRMLTSEGEKIPFINSMKREDGIREIEALMEGSMKGRTMIVGFFSLGPLESPMSLKAVQITDSFYVMHSELILYRTAYQYFVENEGIDFLRFVHSQGELDERKTSKNLKNRRVFFDLESSMSLSVNTQYAGNTVGPKKLAFRLTINKAVNEGWLSEHMFIMGVNGPNGRVTYLTGAFPSGCGKTSTCTVQGERIVGDDLALIRERDGQAFAISPEIGIFGIIEGINKEDDKAIWNVLHGDDEVIYSNVLISDGKPYWNGMGEDIPTKGINHSGEWYVGKKDAEGNEIPPSHKNARFTVSLNSFPGLDRKALNEKNGVPVGGMIFGGRDSDTWPPVCEALSWDHGVVNKGASIESESTAATLGKVGVRTFNAMSIMEFMSVDLGKYLRNYLDFGKKLKNKPSIFGVNYFLKENGKYLNDKVDKAVWLKWMERRVHGEIGAIKTPIGYIPKYEDLKPLFKSVLGKEYTLNDYEKQFAIRASKLIEKNKRIRDVYATIKTTPPEVFRELDEETARLIEAQKKLGDVISPLKFA